MTARTSHSESQVFLTYGHYTSYIITIITTDMPVYALCKTHAKAVKLIPASLPLFLLAAAALPA